MSQLRAFDEKPTAKRALYVLRTAATGRHLLALGDVVTDVARLSELVPAEIGELLEIKQRAERQELALNQVAQWRTRLAAAIEAIDEGIATSVLPAEPSVEAIAAVDAWLRHVRQSYW